MNMLLEQLAVKPNSGRILLRQLPDHQEVMVGVLHFPKDFAPKEGASYMAIFSDGKFHVLPEVIDADIPVDYQGGMEGTLRGDCWRKTNLPGALTVRFIETFPESNGWTIYGPSNWPVLHPSLYHRDHAFVEVRQGAIAALSPLDNVNGKAISQLLSHLPVWPDANNVLHSVPTTEARWRQTYYDYALLQARFGAGEISKSELMDAVRADQKIFHIRSLSMDEKYCQYLAELRDAGGIDLQRPFTAEEAAERDNLSRSTIMRVMGGPYVRKPAQSAASLKL